MLADMKTALLSTAILIALNSVGFALKPADLEGEWISNTTSKPEEEFTLRAKEIRVFYRDGKYYNEGLVAITHDKEGYRIFTFGGPEKGTWTIKGKELHIKTDNIRMEFFSSAIEEMNQKLFQESWAEDIKEPTIYALISQEKDKLVLKGKDDNSQLILTRRPVPQKTGAQWAKPLVSYAFEELGGDPTIKTGIKNDPAGERYRRFSTSLLEMEGFKFSRYLPTFKKRAVIGEGLRAKEEIADRILCNYLVWAFVYNTEEKLPTKNINAFVKRHHLANKLTKNEKAILAFERTKAEAQFGDSIGWKLENTWALAWVLGFEESIDVDQAPFGDATAPALLKFMMSIASNRDTFLKTCKMRPLMEVAQMEDLFYCAHNAVRSAQTGKADAVPAWFDAVKDGGIIHEKRHALTWAISPGVSWENTDLST